MTKLFYDNQLQSSALRFKGAIIDGLGNEVPITEQMILEACKSMEQVSSQAFTSTKKNPERSMY